MCTPNVSYVMGRHKDTQMKGVQDNVGSWEGRTSEMYMDLCVCKYL